MSPCFPDLASGMRPVILGRMHMASTGHYLATQAALSILERGGNAVDAGVAASLTLGVVQSDIVNIAGVAPVLLYIAAERRVISVSGLGGWPRRMTPTYFQDFYAGQIPDGVLRTVVPAAPATWLALLEKHGTLTFEDVASSAIEHAVHGFIMHPLMSAYIADRESQFRQWPSSAAIYLPDGRAPVPGVLFKQTDLGRTLQYMVDQERSASPAGREAGLRAARDAFYRGDIAAAIVSFHRQEGGLLGEDDLSDYEPDFEEPVRSSFRDWSTFSCGPWCQGPSLLQLLKLLENADLEGLGHNSAAYVHTFLEAIKLCYSDRDRYMGDPRFVDVPLDDLLSARYNEERFRKIDLLKAHPGIPAPGMLRDTLADAVAAPGKTDGKPGLCPDTSYVAVIDRFGNAFSGTPSDAANDTPVIPGTGLCPSSRGSQGWADPGHASSVAPGKRPRLTPSPAITFGPDGSILTFGSPGGDVQPQAMAQVFINIAVFGMNVQTATEMPRFASYSFVGSFEPHPFYPARANLERAFGAAIGDDLAGRGHDVQWWPDRFWQAGAVCVVQSDPERGLLMGGADPRRLSYAIGR